MNIENDPVRKERFKAVVQLGKEGKRQEYSFEVLPTKEQLLDQYGVRFRGTCGQRKKMKTIKMTMERAAAVSFALSILRGARVTVSPERLLDALQQEVLPAKAARQKKT